jgi:hypothetical protein
MYFEGVQMARRATDDESSLHYPSGQEAENGGKALLDTSIRVVATVDHGTSVVNSGDSGV